MARLEWRLGSIVALMASSALAQPCEPHWSREFPDSKIFGKLELRSLAVFDDGSGPHVYIGGDFGFYPETPGGGRYLGRWGDPFWENLGGVSPSAAVNCLLIWDDGSGPSLYVGGQFHDIGAEPVRYIASWDGKAWSYMDTGLNNYPQVTEVNALAVYDDGTGPALYAGGAFRKSGDLSTELLGIARWDGQHWQPVGGGVTRSDPNKWGVVHDLAVHDDGSGPALYASGFFDAAGGVPVEAPLARWDGQTWAPAGEPLEPHFDPECPTCFANIRALASFDDGTGPALYVSGDLQAPGVAEPWIARLRDGKWEQAGKFFGHRRFGGADGIVELETLAVLDDGSGPALYVSGLFQTHETPPGVKDGGCLARWDPATQSWTDLDANPRVKALAVHDEGSGSRLWAGGPFGHPGGIPGTALATLGPDGWKRVGRMGRGGRMAAFDDGTGPALYVGGSFDAIGDLPVAYDVARWSSAGWSTVGSWADLGGDRADVSDLTVLDLGDGPALYANISRLLKDGIFKGAFIAPVGRHTLVARQSEVRLRDEEPVLL